MLMQLTLPHDFAPFSCGIFRHDQDPRRWRTTRHSGHRSHEVVSSDHSAEEGNLLAWASLGQRLLPVTTGTFVHLAQ